MKKNKPLEVSWRNQYSAEEQERISAEFEEFLQRGYTAKEAALYIVNIGVCGPEGGTRFSPAMNTRIHAVLERMGMTNPVRIYLYKKKKDARERNDDFEANYLESLRANLIRVTPNQSWLKPPDKG